MTARDVEGCENRAVRDGLEGLAAPDAARLEAWGLGAPELRTPKILRLAERLEGLGSVIVAYSGGADSAFLLRVARAVLGDRALGVLADSESLDRTELAEARRTAEAMGIPITVVETREHENPAYLRNDASRCYHCKSELFSVLRRRAREIGIEHVADGSNADDAGDYRPGLRARDEHGVLSPLLEVGLTKDEIRRASRALGLRTWDKPAAPCLSSRIPYGTPVTFERLRQVEAAEKVLRDLGFRVARVRHHGEIARVEVGREDFARIVAPDIAARAAAGIRAAGYRYVALDLEGFRSGSLNRALEDNGVVPVKAPGAAEGSSS